MIQTQEQWEQDMGRKILSHTQDTLYFDFPYLSLPLHALVFQSHEQVETLATDGQSLFYAPKKMISLFQNNPSYLNRAFLHSIFHCLFSHLWIRQQRNETVWNIACDIAVEYTIDHLKKTSTKRILSLTRKQVYSQLEEEKVPIAAASIYQWLYTQKNLAQLQAEFYTDDHHAWPKEENSQVKSGTPALQQAWQNMARQTSMEQKRQGQDQEDGQQIAISQMKVQKNQKNYREFLQKFAILKEEVQLDLDDFDLNAYAYGLQLYENMPLIEPLETKEVKKIREFVIVLDTSYSTSGTLIKRFLEETFTILSSTQSFFQKTKIYILQCDDQIQKVDVVHSQEEMERLLQDFEVIGQGNTDFRPAFAYVEQLLHEQTLKEVSGLLYFTDGKGKYPQRRPSYPCAFLFLEAYDEKQVPPWAIALRLDQQDLERKSI